MVNRKEKILRDVEYKEEIEKIQKEEKATKTKVSKENSSVDINSQLRVY